MRKILAEMKEMDTIVKKLFQMDPKSVAKIRDVLVPKN